MKKILLALVLFGTTLFGINTVSAKEVNLDNIDTNSYIIGERVYELNTHFLSIYDVVVATNEYAKNHNNELAPIYYLGEYGEGTKYLLEILGSADSNGNIPNELIEDITTVYPGNVMNATAINNELLSDDVESDIVAEKDELLTDLAGVANEIADDYGFESVEYDAEEKTATFVINNPEFSLLEFKDERILNLIMENLEGATKANYKLNGTPKEVNLVDITEDEVTDLALEALEALTEGKELELSALVGEPFAIDVTYGETVVTYYIKFVYEETVGTIVEKDEVLTDLAGAANEVADEYGFETVEYDAEEKTATLTINNPYFSLLEFKDETLLALIMENLEGATKANYTINGTPKEVNLVGITEDEVTEKALEALALATEGKDLVLGSLAGETFVVDVTYGETVVTYYIKFVYEETVETIVEKDEVITDLAGTANEVADDFGFETVEYDAETKTATLTISDSELSLSKFNDDRILSVVMDNLEGATKANYTINGVPNEVNLVGITEDELTGKLLDALLDVVGDKDLVLGSLSGETITINVTYGDVVVPYTISFVMGE